MGHHGTAQRRGGETLDGAGVSERCDLRFAARRCVFVLIAITAGCAPQPRQEASSAQAGVVIADDTTELRRVMVAEQLRSRDIRDRRVLEVMERVHRHRFVPADQVANAYHDGPLPIGHRATISQPYIVAYMTQAANVSARDRVLEVGTGSGYQAAVLAELAREVYSIEIVPELAGRADSTLRALGYTNVQVRAGNGWLGWPEAAPFDAIVVTAAPPEVPQALVDQLAVGGVMVVPVGTADQQMRIIRRSRSGITEERTIPVAFVPMTGRPDE